MPNKYEPIQHLLDEVDDYGIIIGLKDRIKDQLKRAYAIGFFHGDDPEGGTLEPRRDPPDSPPASESRVPGPGGKHQAVENHPDDPWRIEHLVPF